MSENKPNELNDDSSEGNSERRKVQEWTIEMQIRLLQFVQQAPSLYDRESSSFRDKIIKQDAWNLIGKNLNITGDDASKHFIYLREKFGRYLRANRSGKVGKFRPENIPVFDRMEFLKNHIIERPRRRPASSTLGEEFEQILGSEQNYEDFSFNTGVSDGLATPNSGGTFSTRTISNDKRKSETLDSDSDEPDSEVHIVESRTLRSTHKQPAVATRGSKSLTNKSPKLESDSDSMSEKLREVLDRGPGGHENSPNYLFGLYVWKKLDKMSSQDAAACTFRIHELLYQTEVGKCAQSLQTESSSYSNGISRSSKSYK